MVRSIFLGLFNLTFFLLIVTAHAGVRYRHVNVDGSETLLFPFYEDERKERYPISYFNSDVNGLCQYLGFHEGVLMRVASLKTSDFQVRPLAGITLDGRILKTLGIERVYAVVCRRDFGMTVPNTLYQGCRIHRKGSLKIAVIDVPRFDWLGDGNPVTLDFRSSPIGICQLFGYTHYLGHEIVPEFHGTFRYGDIAFVQNLRMRINDQGYAARLDYSRHYYKEIICSKDLDR